MSRYIGLMRHKDAPAPARYSYFYEFHREDETLQPLPFDHYWNVCLQRLGAISAMPAAECSSAQEPLICFELVQAQGRQLLIDFEPKIKD